MIEIAFPGGDRPLDLTQPIWTTVAVDGWLKRKAACTTRSVEGMWNRWTERTLDCTLEGGEGTFALKLENEVHLFR